MSWRLTDPGLRLFSAQLNNNTEDSVSKVAGTATALTYTDGPYGKAIADFNATTSKIDFGSDLFSLGDISVSAFIKIDGWGENSLGMILTNGKINFQIWGGQTKVLFARDGTEGTAASLNPSLALNGLYHIVVTSTSVGVTNLYIDGALNGNANQTAGTPEAGTTNTIIGNSDANDRTFDGKIFSVKAFGCILTWDEVIKLNRMDRR